MVVILLSFIRIALVFNGKRGSYTMVQPKNNDSRCGRLIHHHHVHTTSVVTKDFIVLCWTLWLSGHAALYWQCCVCVCFFKLLNFRSVLNYTLEINTRNKQLPFGSYCSGLPAVIATIHPVGYLVCDGLWWSTRVESGGGACTTVDEFERTFTPIRLKQSPAEHELFGQGAEIAAWIQNGTLPSYHIKISQRGLVVTPEQHI